MCTAAGWSRASTSSTCATPATRWSSARSYDAEGADELTFLDISASVEGRETTLEVVRRTAETVFIPLTVGGGVGSVDDVDLLLRAGADKVAINTGAIHRPEVIAEITRRFGNQVLVLSVDARRAPGQPSGFEVTTHGGRKAAGLDAVEWARRGVELGVGEILLNSMDADGTTGGFDLEMIAAVRAVVDVPLIASGGAGRVEDFPPAVAAGADAVLAATVFHFGTLRIADVKAAIAAAGYPVRGLPVRVGPGGPDHGAGLAAVRRPGGGRAPARRHPGRDRGRLLPRRRRPAARLDRRGRVLRAAVHEGRRGARPGRARWPRCRSSRR